MLTYSKSNLEVVKGNVQWSSNSGACWEISQALIEGGQGLLLNGSKLL